MWKDPIVEETRSVGMKLSKKVGHNVHQLCEILRKAEKKHTSKLVHREPLPLLKKQELKGCE
jgi:hypothetical protein